MAIAEARILAADTIGRKSVEEQREAVAQHMEAYFEKFNREGMDWGEQLVKESSHKKFSYNALSEAIRQQAAERQLSETITFSQMASSYDLITTNQIMTDYEATPALYEAIAEIQNTNKFYNEFPEEWSDDLPVKVSELEEAPESRVSGMSYRIRVFEYARLLSISKRAFDNDDKGFIKSRVANFAKNYKKVIDRAFIYTMFRQLTSANPYLPATNILGGTAYAPSTPGPITPQRLQDAYILASYIQDPFGEYIGVTPDTLVVDSSDMLRAKQYLNSLYSPTQFGPSSTGYTADTAPGSFTQNVLNGIFTIAHSSYVKMARTPIGGSGAPALLMEAKRGQMVLLKKDLTIEMENPQAGLSFRTRSYNWQGTLEFGTGNRNPRLFIIIN